MMQPRPEPRVVAFLNSIVDEGLGISSITIWEILNGIGNLDPGKRRENLAVRFYAILDELFEDRIVDWTLFHTRGCARIMKEKRRIGESLDDHVADAFLVAVASSHGLAVLTRNTAHFRIAGVKIVDPWR